MWVTSVHVTMGWCYDDVDGDSSSLTDRVNLISIVIQYTIVFFLRKLLKAVSIVTLEDIQRVGREYFSRMFDTLRAVCAVCCNPSKLDEISACLQT